MSMRSPEPRLPTGAAVEWFAEQMAYALAVPAHIGRAVPVRDETGRLAWCETRGEAASIAERLCRLAHAPMAGWRAL